MKASYYVKRIALFLVVIVLAASVNFIIPRMAPGNPIGAMVEQLTSRGQSVSGTQEVIAAYAARFGLDRPLWQQYISYLTDTVLLTSDCVALRIRYAPSLPRSPTR